MKDKPIQVQKGLLLPGEGRFNETALNSSISGDKQTAIKRLRSTVKKVKRGDLGELENALVEQAELLNFLFAQTAVQAAATPQIKAKCHLLSTALKAQNASRKTILAIAELKNPKQTTFIKQQQNNLIAGERQNGLPMDARTEIKAESADSRVDAVACEYRADDERGQSSG